MTNKSQPLLYLLGIAAFLLLNLPTTQAAATVTAIHSFSPLGPNGGGLDEPLAQGNDGNFYGTATTGGLYGSGTVFKITPTGNLTLLYSFTGGNDGGAPRGALALGTNGSFYGVTQHGGTNGLGTVFMITPGGGFTSLHSFASETDGADPLAGMVLATNGDFYGTTSQGGPNEYGGIFQITHQGEFSVVYLFHDQNDGAGPLAPLAVGPDGQLYGVTTYGGSDWGTIFKITTSGSITPLYSFTDGDDGQGFYGGLVLATDGNFYGTAVHGTTGYGCVFQISPSGAFAPIFDFSDIQTQGSGPVGTLIQASDGNLYGTTLGGGTNDAGTIFQISTNGAFNSLYSFTNGFDGAEPFPGLVQGTNGTFYGLAGMGISGAGAIYSITTNGVFDAIYNFPGGGGDGASPRAGLLFTNNVLYGAALDGGTNGDGALFESSTNGEVTPLFSFTGGTNSEQPWSTLIMGSDGNLYGTTGYYGGSLSKSPSPYGTVFRMTTNGDLTTLYSFKGTSDGASPRAGVIQALEGNFYGTTLEGGSGNGVVFKITSSGVITNIHSLNGTSDGTTPWAGLVQGSDTNIYGVASGGGNDNNGTVFKITPKGAFSVVFSFSGSNGSYPASTLIQAGDGNLYGTTVEGGSANYGTVFQLTPGTPATLKSLYSFTNGMDGSSPDGGLVQGDGDILYGTAFGGGANGSGTIYSVTTTGVVQILHSFSAVDSFGFNQDGSGPFSAMVRAGDGSFYGTTEFGGASGTGAIFRLIIGPPPPPQFASVSQSAGELEITWSTEPGYNYQLQYRTNLAEGGWSNLGVLRNATNLALTFGDFDPPDPQRFYRVVLVP